VTLILGMSKAEGIYLSVDHRVTDSRTGRKLDDASVKFLTVHYPPEKEGAKALLAYTGIAQLPDGTPVGDWLRETLRGETEVPAVSMHHLHQRLDRDLAALGHGLIVVVFAIQEDRRYVGGFSNTNANGDVLQSFTYRMDELTGPVAFASGSGSAPANADGHLDILRKQLNVRPRHPREHMKLLATMNRRVAKVENSVSPHCHVSFINADDRYGPTIGPACEVFHQHGESVPFRMPILHWGADLSYMFEEAARALRAFDAGTDPPAIDPDEVNKHQRRRP
jgi:hypothetical protein